MKKNPYNLCAAAVLAVALVAGPALRGQDTVQTTTTTSGGTITEFNPDAIVVKTESAPEPVRYTYTKSTTYVDENGNPVSMEVVKSGLPVTVYYEKDGDNLVASKVIVRNAPAPAAAAVPIPGIQETRSTTTTTTTTNK